MAKTGFERARWNAKQLLAWVFTRDRNAVELAHEAEVNNWGMYLEVTEALKRFANNPNTDNHEEADDPTDNLNVHNAINQIEDRLENEKLKARGTKGGKGNLKEIPCEHWVICKLDIDQNRSTSRDTSNTDATVWHDLAFKKSEALSIWPESETLASSQSAQRTGKANDARINNAKERREMVCELINNIYEAGRKAGLNWALQREPIPFTRETVYKYFFKYWAPKCKKVKLASFKRHDLSHTQARFSKGTKSLTLKELRELLAKSE